MLTLSLEAGSGPLDVLLVGAHPDDIEIGCGATVMQLAKSRPIRCHWIVLTASPERAAEARAAADAFGADAVDLDVRVESFPESYLPYDGRAVKDYVQGLARELAPDVIFTHHGGDLHQDHRLLAELCWNAFRDHLILEFEIPKYDGDLGRPNVFSAVDVAVKERKIELLMSSFPSQRARSWYTAETFAAMLRMRGVEARAPSGYAEAFYARKISLASI
jgi:LmbE family N-acetylglucosaminyl deacetylase